MRREINDQLRRIEQVHGVRILHAVESGSRVWGFESPNSDYDVRFIYVRPPEWYLSVHPRRDVIELPLIDGLLDINGWDLKKALALMGKSNPPLYEWLNSPTVYRTSVDIDEVRRIAPDYLNHKSAIHHYLSLASGNYKAYLQADEVKLKKYFYVVRALLCCHWIHTHGGFPPVEFVRLDLLSLPTGLPTVILDLLDRKRSLDELGTGRAIPELNAWIKESLDYYADVARTAAPASGSVDQLNATFLKILFPDLP